VALIADRMAYKFGVTEEKAIPDRRRYDQPLGVYTASASGISTGRDISTGNTTTAITFDGLDSREVRPQAAVPRRGPRGTSTATAVTQIAKLKDAEGSTSGSRPRPRANRTACLGAGGRERVHAEHVHHRPVRRDDRRLVLLLDRRPDGDWRCSASTNSTPQPQVGFIGRKYTDGAPVLETAFARVKLG
jgi:hypothetical protein